MSTSLSTKQLDNAFSALAHSGRRGMIHDLAYRPATVSQLAKSHKLTLPAIHKHIRLLEKAKLIQRRKAGRTNFVALNPRQLRAVQEWLMQYRAEWGNNKETLENYIASLKD
jgi:DNA-binding transcriptional ArsR family regulator